MILDGAVETVILCHTAGDDVAIRQGADQPPFGMIGHDRQQACAAVGHHGGGVDNGVPRRHHRGTEGHQGTGIHDMLLQERTMETPPSFHHP